MSFNLFESRAPSGAKETVTEMMVDPGACGFTCRIKVEKKGPYKATVRLKSKCRAVCKLADEISDIDFMQLMRGTFSDNDIHQAAGRSKVHHSCVIPCAITKAVEAELKLAVKKNTTLTFAS